MGITCDGSRAELIEVPRSSLVRKPERLSHEEAGSAGVTFATAWCALIEYAHLRSGETIAIIGSREGVGSAAAQIARHLGARVIGVSRLRKNVPTKGVPIHLVTLDLRSELARDRAFDKRWQGSICRVGCSRRPDV